MMKIWLVVAVVGCGAKPAEPLEPLTPNELALSTPPPSGPVRSPGPPVPAVRIPSSGGLGFPRPMIETQIDPPDVNELGRWPLTIAEHPALEPHFDVASALADPGVTWTDLCARGAQHRHLSTNQELVAYLDAWCSVITSDYSAAITKLGHVRFAANKQLVGALKLDVAAIVAAHGSATDLESFLRGGGFLDLEHVDLVAAAYFEVGKLDDAAVANNTARMMAGAPSEIDRCARVMRAIADTANGDRLDEIADLGRLAYPPADGIRSPHCRVQADMVRCWHDNNCMKYWSDQIPGAEPEILQLFADVYRSWDVQRTNDEWDVVARRLTFVPPLHDRYVLLRPALELALRTSHCKDTAVADVEDLCTHGIDDLTPPHLTAAMDRRTLDAARERTAEIAALTTRELATIRADLRATRARAMSMFRLDPDACTKALAKLPPMQP
jgi:hypothetical protein